jgi:putative sterol carrier protein
MRGDVNGMSAFMSGKLKATGNVMLATRLSALFPDA